MNCVCTPLGDKCYRYLHKLHPRPIHLSMGEKLLIDQTLLGVSLRTKRNTLAVPDELAHNAFVSHDITYYR